MAINKLKSTPQKQPQKNPFNHQYDRSSYVILEPTLVRRDSNTGRLINTNEPKTRKSNS